MRHALITGASEGIGRAFACRLAADYRLTLVARNDARLQALCAELPGSGHRYLSVDLESGDGLARIEDYVLDQRCHLLINNAGFSEFGAFTSKSAELQSRIIKLNCDALMRLSHAFLQQAQQGDALLNISSVLAFMPMTGQPVYAASKAFVTSLSDALWQEQKDRGVYVLGFCPGSTRSEFYARAGGHPDHAPPSFLYQSAEQVVEEALLALARRRHPMVISGRTNRSVYRIMKLLRRSWVAALMARMR